MRKVISKIPVLFLWAAWILLTAHSVIPHDHHSSESYGKSETSCPAPDHETDNHSKIPGHCHALNDLTSEKVQVFSFLSNFISIDFIQEDVSEIKTSELYLHSCKILYLPEHLPVSHLLEHSPFRAPPVLS